VISPANEERDLEAAVRWLRTPEAVRARSALVLAAAEADLTPHFAIDHGRLDDAAELVARITREHYPDLDIPLHSRWRHFAFGARDRWREREAQLDRVDRDERARIRFDLVIPSVLLDAGAGERWRWREPSSGEAYARSEGLALASLALFERGLLSSHLSQPLRADGAALRALEPSALAEAFQVSADNPLAGLEGRALLLNRLGAAIELDPERFGQPARLGNLYDYLKAQARDGRLAARTILLTLLESLATIWPGRIALGQHNLGDVGRHPAARANDPTGGLVPFHKLSQWLACSLIEPLQDAGIEVIDPDALTALAEYRNGGLLIDSGVVVPKHPAVLSEAHTADAEIVVEWRALTVALIDRLADLVRAKLGLTPERLPLAKVLQGGTWSAGRALARQLRGGGGPPLSVISDGTLF
jgi:Protein of unknown function (DUF1688)